MAEHIVFLAIWDPKPSGYAGKSSFKKIKRGVNSNEEVD
jgi:hypothetical protein